jgi:hypothetical protein
MARIRTVSNRICGDFLSICAIVHAPIVSEMDQEGAANPSRIRLPYRDVHKFHFIYGMYGNLILEYTYYDHSV